MSKEIDGSPSQPLANGSLPVLTETPAPSAAYTAGPWTVRRDRKGRPDSIWGHGDYWIAGQIDNNGYPANDANACLIAAAPELLEALRDALAGWRYIRDHHGDLYGVGWDRVEQAASAAIAKAEGRA